MLEKLRVFIRQREGQLFSLPVLTAFWSLLSVVALAPYLFLGHFIAPGADTIAYFYPAFYWFSKNLSQGTSFLWDPHILSGFPLYLTQIGGFLEPINLFLFSVLPFVLAYHVRLLINFTLVMLFSYLAARKWGISRLAAFCIGPAYLMSFHWWYLSTPTLPSSLFVMPFVFWIYMNIRDAISTRSVCIWTILGGMGVGLAFLGGYAQFIFYSMFFLGLYFLYDFFFIMQRHERSIRKFLVSSASLGAIGIIALIVGAPTIVPSLQYVPHTIRAGGVSYEESQIKVLNVKEPIFLLFPDYIRFPLLNGGKKSLFIGVTSFLLALIAFAYWRRNKQALIFGALCLLAFILAFPGSYLYWGLHHLPGFELFRYPHRFLYNGIWFLAVLGAIGFDMVATERVGRSARIVAFGGLTISVVCAFLIFASTLLGEWFWSPAKQIIFSLFANLIYASETFPKGLPHYEGALSRGVDAWRELMNIRSMPFIIPAASLIFSSAVVASRVFEYISPRQFRLFAAATILSTFLGVFIARWPDSISARTVIETAQSTAHMLPQEDLLQYRAHAFHTGNSFVPKESNLIWRNKDVLAAIELQHATQVPNINRYSGILETDGYEPFISPDLLYVMSVYFTSNVTSQDLLKNVSFDDRKKIFLSHLDLLGMMAGKYVISGVPLVHPNLQLLHEATGSSYNAPFYIYVNALARPRVRLALSVEALPHKTVRELVEQGKHFDAEYLDCAACATHTNPREASLIIHRQENGYFDIRIEARSPQWLIVAEQFVPGWRVTLDGQEITPTRANGMYMAIPIPEGTHRVVLEYRGVLGEATILEYLGLHPTYR